MAKFSYRIMRHWLMAKGWSSLSGLEVEARGADGTTKILPREVADHGDGAAILPIDGQNAGLVLIKAGVWPDIPETYVWSRRSADGWSAPVSLGTAFPGNGFSQPFGAVAAAGARFALLLHTPADGTHTTGLNLMTWDAGNGWLTTWLPEWNPYALPWIGFDAQGGLHALVSVL